MIVHCLFDLGLGKEFSDEKILTEGNERVIIGSNVEV